VILHVVLFRPRPDLSREDRQAFAAALARARDDIPSIRRLRLGRRVTHGRGYERLAPENYSYALIVEFEDLRGLQTYLEHPAHEALGRLFGTALAAAGAYDYDAFEVVSGDDLAGLLSDW
jgi:hypothetical protein